MCVCSPLRHCVSLGQQGYWWGLRNLSHGRVNLVITGGKTKFETHEVEPPKKDKWKTKKRLKMQRKREKEKRKAANRKDPRRLGVKGKKKKQRFGSAEERIKYKIEKVSYDWISSLFFLFVSNRCQPLCCIMLHLYGSNGVCLLCASMCGS